MVWVMAHADSISSMWFSFDMTMKHQSASI